MENYKNLISNFIENRIQQVVFNLLKSVKLNSTGFREFKRMGKTKMTKKAARRIQYHVDKTGKNQDFKARAQRAASRNKK